MPKISVIIPVYNVEEYLQECLDSVLNQSLKDLEIICVNDGSSDNSLQILQDYAKQDSRIKIINQENKGLAQARNTGLDVASAEYIFFLDSDDYIVDGILEKLFRAAKITDADVTMSKARVFSDEDEFAHIVESNNKNLFNIKHIVTKIDISNFVYMMQNYPPTSWGSLYKREFIEKNKLRFIAKHIMHEDEGFRIKVFCCNPLFCAIEDIGVMYRRRGASITLSSTIGAKERGRHIALVIEDALNYIKLQKSRNEYSFYKKWIVNFFGMYLNDPLYLIKQPMRKLKRLIKLLFFTPPRELTF